MLHHDYRMTSAAARYLVGFIVNGLVYCANLAEIADDMFAYTRESSSHGGAPKLKLRLTERMKRVLVAKGATILGTPDTVLKGEGNKGEQFERYIVERAGLEYHKDTTPYYVAPDAVIDGIGYQIKFQNASFANANTIAKAMKAKGL